METGEAQVLLGFLRAAWSSSRDLPRSTVELYTAEIGDLRCVQCAAASVHELIRTSRFFPAVADLLADYRDEFRANHASHGEPALPEEASWTPQMVAEARARGVEILAKYREEHPRPTDGEVGPFESLEDVVAKPIEIDEADVALKRARARQLNDRIQDGLGVGL